MKKTLILFILLISILGAVICAGGETTCSHVLVNCESAGSGYHIGTCKLCGAIASEAHTLQTHRVEATCVSPAQVSYVCSKCGYETDAYSEGDVGTNHNWGEYVTVKAATCTSTGEATRTCTLCGKTETVTLPVTEHVYGAWTSVDENYHRRTCIYCGNSYTEKHDAAVARTVTYAQDARLGKKSYTCSACGYMYTRYYAASNAKLYTKSTTDLEGCILVETISGEAGKTYTVRTYPDSVFELAAETDCEFKIYADASSLEYRGFSLASGTAKLSYESGSAVLDFITCNAGAELALDPAKGSVIVGSAAFSKAADGYLVFTYAESGTAHMSVFNKGTAQITDSGKAGTGDVILTATAAYDAKAQKLTITVSDSKYNVQVYSGETNVFTGSKVKEYSCQLTATQAAAGWYIRLADSHVYISAVLDEENQPYETVSETEAEAETVVTPDATQEPEAGVPETITLDSSVETLVHKSPDIRVTVNEGMYTVEITNLPEGWSVNYVRFLQKFDAGGMKMLNVYGADTAEFAMNAYAGTVSAEAYLTDSTGDPIQYAAGSFTLGIN